jgi:hypothetical protein
MERSAARLTFLFLAMLVSACGGGGATTAPGGGSETPAATDAAPATEPAPTGVATDPSMDIPPAPTPGGGDPSTAEVCGLVTIAEMEQIFGVSGVTQMLFAGPPDTCDYRLNDAPFAAVVLTPFSASPIFDAMAADAASEQVDGVGDRALYNSQMLTFIVQKGDSLLAIQVLDQSRSEAECAELMKQIGATAAGRM